MQSARWLIQQIKRVVFFRPRQLFGQLQPLRLATGKRTRTLAEFQIAEPDRKHHVKNPRDLREVLKPLTRLCDIQLKHIRDRQRTKFRLQSLNIEPPPLTRFAFDMHVRHEVHFHAPHSVALTVIASSSLRIKTESADPVAALLGNTRRRKHFAKMIPQPTKRRGTTFRAATDRFLINQNRFVNLIQPFDRIKRFRTAPKETKMILNRRCERAIDQRTFSRSADT